MAYKFNDGDGAVICDVCRTMIDEDLSYAEYAEIYGDKGDICWGCKKKKANQAKRLKEDILEDGWRN